MRPRPDEVLGILSQTLLLEIAPAISSDYEARSAEIAGMLLAWAQEEWDRTAERLVDENREIEGIFDQAVERLDSPLAASLRAALAARTSSLRLRALHQRNDELRSLLVELQAELEERDDGEARGLLERIWKELRASTERRAISLAPF